MSVRSMIDSLESRRLYSASLAKGLLSVDCTSGNDTVAIAAEGTTQISVTLNGSKTVYTRTAVKKLTVNGGAGNDSVSLNLPAALAAKLPVSILGGAGNDTITTNVAATIDGGDGNDSLTGSTGNDKLFGGNGDDTLSSGGGKDSLNAGPGTNRITYANGDQDAGDLRLRTDKAGRLTIFGSKNNDTFVFNKTTGSNVSITAMGQTLTFDLSKVTAIKLDGGAGQDTVANVTTALGNKPFSRKSVENG